MPSDPDYPDERVSASATPINEARVNKTVRRSLLVLLSAVAVLHLLACANVTNLLLGRVAAKKRECAVRLALGSSWQWNLLNVGYNHQSNGRSDVLSRSWDRVYAEFGTMRTSVGGALPCGCSLSGCVT